MKVFVATIPTYDETIAVALSEDEARRLASEHACKYLHDVGAASDKTDSPEKCEEYFGVRVTEVEIGEATFH